MNVPLKITKIGNSAGVILPKELLAQLRVGPGDMLYVTQAPDGIRLTAADPRAQRRRPLVTQKKDLGKVKICFLAHSPSHSI